MTFIEISNGNNFRHVLALSILSGKSVKIIDFRKNDQENGISECQISLLKLISKITNGSNINISNDESSLTFKPGSLIGGQISHQCSLDRSVTYFLEFISYIIILLKSPLFLTLEGVTNSLNDPTVDFFNFSYINLLKRFGFENIGLKILRRGYLPRGGGACLFECRPILSLNSIDLTFSQKFSQIRGICYCMRVNPHIPTQIIDKVKEFAAKITNHISIDIDCRKSFSGGLSPGFGITLTTVSDTKNVYCGESCIEPGNKEHSSIEQVARNAYIKLCDELLTCASVDRPTRSLLLINMALSPTSVSKCILTHPDEYIIELMRLIKKFLSVSFKISLNNKSNSRIETFVFSCCGIDMKNYNKYRS